ncbi:MAG: hypothetical protein ACI9OJ_004260, partial [Myxococcota bacterium]
MTRRQLLTQTALVLSAVWLVPQIAAAAEPAPGEIWITLKGNDFAKPYIDGEEYSDHEFESMGKKLIIRVEDNAAPYTFELRPSLDTFAPITVTTEGKKYRRKRVRGSKLPRMVMMMAVKFSEKPKEKPKEKP